MTNWLQEFYKIYTEAIERHTGIAQNLSAVEHALDSERAGGIITPQILRIIEESPAWTYPWWWPRMSKLFQGAVLIPTNFRVEGSRHKLIEEMWEHLHHIEVVSVILRFMCPEDFGVMSPPVVSFLHLTPQDNSVADYERYLKVLRIMRDRYGLLRIADTDMAIWSAAHLYMDRDFAALTEEMRRDEYFQQILLENIVQGWSGLTWQTGKRNLTLARVFLDQDYLLAALITGRVYEELLQELGRRWEVPPSMGKLGQSRTGALLDRLKRHPDLQRLGTTARELDDWWDWRNSSIHQAPPITKSDAEDFMREIEKFYRRCMG
jgi:hypothetical protein